MNQQKKRVILRPGQTVLEIRRYIGKKVVYSPIQSEPNSKTFLRRTVKAEECQTRTQGSQSGSFIIGSKNRPINQLTKQRASRTIEGLPVVVV